LRSEAARRLARVVPYPEDDYLLLLGRLVYAVGYLEWSVLGELPSAQIERLAGQTTGALGSSLAGRPTLRKVADSALREWIRKGGKELQEVAPKRDMVLHARPATDPDERQRLYRWHPRREESEWITDELLNQILADICDRLRRLGDPPAVGPEPE